MTRDELKELSAQTFYDNNVGGISAEAHREFNKELLDFIPDTPTTAAGGDLSGTYPNPQIGNNKITALKIAPAAITQDKLKGGAVSMNKLSTDVRDLLRRTLVIELETPLSQYKIDLKRLFIEESEGNPYNWMRDRIDEKYTQFIIKGTDGASMTSLRMEHYVAAGIHSSISMLFVSSMSNTPSKGNLVLSRLMFTPDDRGDISEYFLTIGAI